VFLWPLSFTYKEYSMNNDELNKLLDLEGGTLPSYGSAPTQKPAEASLTALKLDQWSLRKGGELLKESPRLRKLNLSSDAVADLHAAAFLPNPELEESCIDPLRKEFIQELLSTPAYQSLHESTKLNTVAAEIAAVSFAEHLSALAAKVEASPQTPEPKGLDVVVIASASHAARLATEGVQELESVTQAMGMGAGEPGSSDVSAIASVFKAARSNPALLRICSLAGRYRQLAQGLNKARSKNGFEEVTGLESGGDISRLVPSELMKLGIPELELDLMRRLVEKQCLCREFEAEERVGLGPVVLVVDESGSMVGHRNESAKAIALTLAWIARKQGRWCGLVAFSGGTGHRVLSLPPERWKQVDLLDWLQSFLGGGSDQDVPAGEMAAIFTEIGAPVGKTDLIYITDAELSISQKKAEAFKAWKASVQARLISLVLNSSPGQLSSISDEVHLINSLDPTEVGIKKVFSL
jgi:uncharacterized protein with von Willebrand factor type A (vWA) domain